MNPLVVTESAATVRGRRGVVYLTWAQALPRTPANPTPLPAPLAPITRSAVRCLEVPRFRGVGTIYQDRSVVRLLPRSPQADEDGPQLSDALDADAPEEGGVKLAE